MKRRFEFVSGSSAKFYEVYVSGNRVEIRFGRIGADGQSQVKTFDDHAAAQAIANKVIQQKTGKGYSECVAA